MGLSLKRVGKFLKKAATVVVPGVAMGPGGALMGAASLGAFGKGAKNVVRTGGRAISKAAPLVGLIPGAGTVAGAALGGMGGLLAGESTGTIARRAALGAAGGAAGKALTGGRGINAIIGRGGALSQARQLMGGGGPSVEGAAPLTDEGLPLPPTDEGLPFAVPGLPSPTELPSYSLPALGAAATRRRGLGETVLGALGGVARGAGQFISQNPLQAAQLGLAGIGMLQGAGREGRANQMRRQALDLTMPEPTIPDVGGAFADPGNPYATGNPRRRAVESAARSLRY